MFKKLSATILLAVMTAALPLTAFAEVDRESVKDAVFEHLWKEAALDHEMLGQYLARAEENPFPSLYYYYYIVPFVDESNEEMIENLDLEDDTSYSINRFIRSYYSEWESEQPGLLELMIDDGNTYEVIDNQDDKWILEDQNGNVSELEITMNDNDFTFTYNGKEVGVVDRLYQYSYLNDEEEIAYEQAEKMGSEPENYEVTEDYEDDVDFETSTIADNNRPVTADIVSEVDRAAEISNEVSSQTNEPDSSETETKNNTPVIIALIAVIAIAVTLIIIKKKKEN